jgi:hypothetical protein
MTLQEIHSCDICGEKFYVPEEELRTLKLTEANEETFDYDLCYSCKESLMKWILAARRKETKEP